MTESKMSELETLKAQLAILSDGVSTAARVRDDLLAKLQASEAQVRELRKALVRCVWLLTTPGVGEGELKGYAVAHVVALSRKALDYTCSCPIYDEGAGSFQIHAIGCEAALRSAPPSGQTLGITKRDPLPELKSVTLEGLVKAKQAPFDKTNAGEERKDLARQGCTDETRNDPAAGKRPIKAGAEQVPAAHHTRWEGENPHNATVDSRSPRSAESASIQSGPQDSPVCDRCGGKVPVWFAPNEVWNAVIPTRQAMLCVHCFIAAAEASGIQCAGWEVRPENWSGPQDSPSRSPIDNSFKAEGTAMRRFYLQRLKDETGVSRTGRVLEGVLTQAGHVITEWRPPHSTMGWYPDLATFNLIHVDCHPSCSEIVWLDAPPSPAREKEKAE